MTIEQEFFEAFGIETKEKGWCPFLDDRKCINCKSKSCKIKSYPPITPEIVLGLEEIILTETSHISHVQKYGYPILNKRDKKRIGTDWNYIYVVEVYAGCDEYDCQNYDRYEGKGKTRKEALLKLCIQLKDDIQDQVRQLFK